MRCFRVFSILFILYFMGLPCSVQSGLTHPKSLDLPQPQSSVGEQIKQAESFINMGKQLQAIHIYENIAQKYPGNLSTWRRLATLYSWNNMPENSIACLEHIVNQDSSDIESIKKLAQLYSWTNRQTEAIILYKRLVGKEPDNGQLRKSLAELLSWNDMPDQAIVHYEQLLKLNPEDDVVLKKIAQNYFWTGNNDKGIKSLEKIVDIQPDSVEYRRQLAQQYVWNDHQKKAITQYEALLTKDSSDFSAMKQLAQLYAWNGNPEKASGLYAKIIHFNPEDDSSRALLGEVQLFAGNWVEAKSNFDRIIEKDPSNVKAQSQLAKIQETYAPALKLMYKRSSDSNKLVNEQIPLSYTSFRNSRWMLSSSLMRTKLSDDGIDSTVGGYNLAFNSKYSFSTNLSTEMDVGFSTYSMNWQPLNYKLKINYGASGRLFTNFSFRHFETLEGIRAVNNKININEVAGEIYFQASPRLSLSGMMSHRIYSDKNEKRTSLLASKFLIFGGKPYFNLTAYYAFEDFKDIFPSSKPYWTPNKLETTSIGADASHWFLSWLKLGVGYSLTNQRKVYSNNFRSDVNLKITRFDLIYIRYEELGSDFYSSKIFKMYFQHRF